MVGLSSGDEILYLLLRIEVMLWVLVPPWPPVREKHTGNDVNPSNDLSPFWKLWSQPVVGVNGRKMAKGRAHSGEEGVSDISASAGYSWYFRLPGPSLDHLIQAS